jgi:hypothetical protein
MRTRDRLYQLWIHQVWSEGFSSKQTIIHHAQGETRQAAGLEEFLLWLRLLLRPHLADFFIVF